MTTVAEIRAALTCGRAACPCHSQRGNVHCPNASAHRNGDQRPSFSVAPGSRVPIVISCHSSSACTQEVLIEALKERRLWEREEEPGVTRFRPRPTEQAHLFPGEVITHTYQYREPDGLLVAEKARIEKPNPDGGKPSKRFLWRRAGTSGWPGGDSGCQMDQLPLYNAPAVAAAPFTQPVVVVEGEKAVEACAAHGVLAVSFAGGATSRKFGEAFQILTGRDVLIWPDNDVEGRKYGQALHQHLRAIAASAVILPPLTAEEKADAVDYFAGGGTADAVLGQAPTQHPVLQWMDDDAVTIDFPAGDRRIRFEFSEIAMTTRSLDVKLQTGFVSPGYKVTARLPTRLNLLSNTSVADYIRKLGDFFPEEKGFWTGPVMQATALLTTALEEHDPSKHASQIQKRPALTYLIDILAPERAPTCWFGNGSSGKSWLAIASALAVALSGSLGGKHAGDGNVLYVDWETDEATWQDRLIRIGAGMGYDETETLSAPIYYWPGRGKPFADQVPALRRKIQKDDIRYVIIDSVSAACGGPPEDAEVAQRFINAYARLGGVTLVALAHISKGSDTKTPFGSIMWHDFFRRTFFILRQQEDESPEMSVGVYCRKANEGAMPRPLGFDFTFQNDTALALPPEQRAVQVTVGDVTAHAMLAEGLNAWSRIRRELLRGSATLDDLTEMLGIPKETIRRELAAHRNEVVNRNPERGKGHVAVYALKTDLGAGEEPGEDHAWTS